MAEEQSGLEKEVVRLKDGRELIYYWFRAIPVVVGRAGEGLDEVGVEMDEEGGRV